MAPNMYFPVAVSLVGLLILFVNIFLFLKERKGKDMLYHILTFYLVGMSIVEVLCNVIGSTQPGSNFYLSHFYFIFNFLVLGVFFYQFFLRNIVIRRLMVVIYIIVLSIIIGQYINNPELFWRFNPVEVVSISLTLILLSLFGIYNVIEEKSPQYFNFFIGLIVYFVPSSIIFLSGNFDLTFMSEPIILDIWIFNSLGYIVYQIFVYREWRVLTERA